MWNWWHSVAYSSSWESSNIYLMRAGQWQGEKNAGFGPSDFSWGPVKSTRLSRAVVLCGKLFWCSAWLAFNFSKQMDISF